MATRYEIEVDMIAMPLADIVSEISRLETRLVFKTVNFRRSGAIAAVYEIDREIDANRLPAYMRYQETFSKG